MPKFPERKGKGEDFLSSMLRGVPDFAKTFFVRVPMAFDGGSGFVTVIANHAAEGSNVGRLLDRMWVQLPRIPNTGLQKLPRP